MLPIPLDNGAMFVSSSFLDTLVCPRASEYYKLNGRVSDRGTSAMTFGQHIHSALSLYYRLQEYNLDHDTIMSRVSTLLEMEFSAAPVDPEDWRNLNWAMETFQQLVRKYREEDFEVVRYKEARKCKKCNGKGKEVNLVPLDELIAGDDDTDPGVSVVPCLWCNGTGLTTIMSEIPFAVKLFDYRDYHPGIGSHETIIPIYYHGFIDLLISRRGLLYVMDFKSTSQLGPSYWDDKKAIAQPKGYAWALEQLLGVKVHGYLIRAIRTIPPPKYVTDGTASKKGEFKKISDWWDESLSEQSYELGEGELSEWKENAIAQVKQFFYHHSQGIYPQNKSMCIAKYGKCQYFEVCSTFPASDRIILLNSTQFKTKEQNMNLLK